jgi:2-dehydro-3-deoxyphosphogluconate aldolase / (4S)-4-hydroxy-2-oxoglutarate aldolase
MSFIEHLKQVGVVAIIRCASADEAVAMGEALIRGGVLGVEVTYSTPGCCDAIRRLVAKAPAGAAIGVGTVLTLQQLDDAVAAGATYIVSPHTDEALIARAQELGVASLPGAITPTEVVRAYQAGATVVKLFPGSLVGPDYLKALKAPLPHIPIMPTGGVTPANLHEWFAAGAVAVGMGGNLAKGTPAEIEQAARIVRKRIDELRTASAAR